VSEPTPQPALRIVRGEPTPEELAVVAAVVTAAASGGSAAAEPARERGRWNDPAHVLRRPLPPPGPGGWRSAAR
jgi:hypothetical protein